jgi:translation initiation factor RLI1
MTGKDTEGERGTAMMPYAGDTLSRSRQWTDLSGGELRRLAVAACRDQDEETL